MLHWVKVEELPFPVVLPLGERKPAVTSDYPSRENTAVQMLKGRILFCFVLFSCLHMVISSLVVIFFFLVTWGRKETKVTHQHPLLVWGFAF